MSGYRIRVLRTLKGEYQFIELGSQSYGEWIICENDIPKFHVNIFRENSKSDKYIRKILGNTQLNIDSIIKNISQINKKNLAVQRKPLVSVEVRIEFKSLELEPIPIKWFSEFNLK